MNDSPLHLFEGYGIELEYMIVDRETLSILPITDQLIYSIAGSFESEIERGALCWSNELVLHVVELKTNGPISSLNGIDQVFQSHIQEINQRLAQWGARLMPTAMHPWMNPEKDTRLWPHDYNVVYESYNRIFGCQGHGWSNLQSVHLNLPFANDEEFGRLHAAIRLLLPLLPALGASSPLVECQRTDFLDNRMEFYRTNSKRIPSITGQIIPEPVFSRDEYERQIFQPMFENIAPLDPNGILQHEWLNARGAIARFDRNAIEIRVLDIQECPQADVSIVSIAASALQALIAEQWSSLEEQKRISTDTLATLFNETIRKAESTPIQNAEYLQRFGLHGKETCTAGELWNYILDRIPNSNTAIYDPIRTILQKGSLANRIVQRLDGDLSRKSLSEVYRQLSECLEYGTQFIP